MTDSLTFNDSCGLRTYESLGVIILSDGSLWKWYRSEGDWSGLDANCLGCVIGLLIGIVIAVFFVVFLQYRQRRKATRAIISR